MCVDHSMTCRCGAGSAGFNFRNEVLPVEVIGGLYCPRCSTGVEFDDKTMINDNGWVIDFDMEIAEFMKSKLPAAELTPGFIFDEGYCTWRGVYPSDHIDSVREREDLVKLVHIDKKRYLKEFRDWSIRRMERLAGEGWRKAREEK